MTHAQSQGSATSPTDIVQFNYSKGLALQKQMVFDSAIFFYQRCLDGSTNQKVAMVKSKDVEKRIAECKSGKKLRNESRNFIVTNLGPLVNSPFEDYAPVLTADEQLLVFTSRRPDGNLSGQKSTDGKYFEDVFYSRQSNGKWESAENIGSPINTSFHDSDLALSVDGKKLFLYTEDHQGDILGSEFKNGKWGLPKSLPSPINSPYHESSIAISSDQKKIIVASERPGGLGGSDLYMIEKNTSGQWGAAVNLGPSVNTEWDDDSPFISYDGKTLYFSSRGHNTMGGFDIFRSQKNGDGWLAAENLGFPINTPGNDIYFVSTRDGKRAYYSSVREEGLGEEDIYLITLPKELVEDEAISVLGTQSKPDLVDAPLGQPFLIIHFSFGKHLPPFPDIEKVQDLITRLSNVKDATIQIDGHTDNVGSEKYNKTLSLLRAESVKSYLASKGIAPERMIIKGWGASQPAASNDDEKDGRAQNRRVEIRVNYN